VSGRELLGFGGAVDDVVERLAGDRAVDAELIGQMGDFGNAPAAEVGDAEIAQLAGLDQVGNGAHGLFQRRIEHGAVEIEQIDVIGAEATQRVFDRLDHPFARLAAEVGALVVRIGELGGQHPVIAIGLDALPHDFLGGAIAIDIGGVDEVDALLARLVDDAEGFRIGRLLPEHHGTERERGNLEGAAAEITIVNH
jgi:hypothetical protein